jgi:imidazolonepropionase
MAGESYTGGGIRTTVAATRAASDSELRANVARLILEARHQGTTTMEIKSGYGLSVADEARTLRIAGEFTSETTYLGAHVVPAVARGAGRRVRGAGVRGDARGRGPVRPLGRRVL